MKWRDDKGRGQTDNQRAKEIDRARNRDRDKAAKDCNAQNRAKGRSIDKDGRSDR